MAAISTSATWASWTPEVLYLLVSEANKKAAEHVVKEAQNNLQRGGHNDTGVLSSSFHISYSRYRLLGSEAEVVNTAPYASFVDRGVDGLIYPKTANVLRFKPSRRSSLSNRRGVYNAPGTGRFTSSYVYRPYVHGQEATNFFTDAVNSLSLYDFL